MIDKYRIVVFNKTELVEEEYLKSMTKKLENLSKKKVLAISSSLRKGLTQLLSEVWKKV